jgi:hypothetical protein
MHNLAHHHLQNRYHAIKSCTFTLSGISVSVTSIVKISVLVISFISSWLILIWNSKSTMLPTVFNSLDIFKTDKMTLSNWSVIFLLSLSRFVIEISLFSYNCIYSVSFLILPSSLIVIFLFGLIFNVDILKLLNLNFILESILFSGIL